MPKANGATSEPPIKYPTWEFEGVVYTLKHGYASTYQLGEYGIRPEQVKEANQGVVSPNLLLKLAASMMGTVDRKGKWRPAKIDPLELAASIESEDDWKDLAQAVAQASEKINAATTAASASPQGETPGPLPN